MYITTRQKKKIVFYSSLILGSVLSLILLTLIVVNVLKFFDGDTTPRDVILANVDTTSVTINWRTMSSAESFVKVYQDGEPVGEFFDARGQSSFYTHYIDINNLEPNTRYTFEIVSDGENYTQEDENEFVFATAPVLGHTPSPVLVNGKIADVAHSDVLVFLTSDEEDAIPLSTYVSNMGDWSLDISRMRTADLTSYFDIDKTSDTRLQIAFLGDMGSKIVVGNTNVLFDEDGFLGEVSLDGQEVDIFADLYQPDSFEGVVMGEMDHVREDREDDSVVSEVNEEDSDDERGREEVQWEPLSL